ncbi:MULTISPECIES: hypothetical protein [unclassified Streptomyces]|uniref:hypothetical protein n=1 Tax=unclassified Streptomyces TaxID=2593676 RepID=UPI002E2CBA1A|nr:hypothetical protein [Streptomyces sp. NBC_00273]
MVAAEAVEAHVRAFFEGHSVEVVVRDLGSDRREIVSDLRVLVVGPGPRSDSWAYVTAGCWAAMEKDGHGLEFVLTAHVRDQRFIDLMAMIAYYLALFMRTGFWHRSWGVVAERYPAVRLRGDASRETAYALASVDRN